MSFFSHKIWIVIGMNSEQSGCRMSFWWFQQWELRNKGDTNIKFKEELNSLNAIKSGCVPNEYSKPETPTFHRFNKTIEEKELITSRALSHMMISTLKSVLNREIPIFLFKKKYNFHNDMNFQYYNSIESKMMIFFLKSLTILIFRNESIPLIIIIENNAHWKSNVSETCWFFIINNLHAELRKSFDVWYLENDGDEH